MTEMQIAVCSMIDLQSRMTPQLRKTGEVVKEICRESGEAAIQSRKIGLLTADISASGKRPKP